MRIDEEELCPRFAAAVANVRIGRSPAWLAARLQAAGVRPISNIVDITNYVNLELGQPMHAYDLARLAGASLIRVRRAKPGETITTLDGVERKLDPEMLVIADRDRSQGIAGVMGGAASEVSAATTHDRVRGGVLQAGLDPAHQQAARPQDRGLVALRARRRHQRAGRRHPARGGADAADRRRPSRSDRSSTSTRSRASRGGCTCAASGSPALLGASVPDADVIRILRGLGLEVTPAADGWDAVAPTFRVDLLREADLIEEVGRHYGFDKLEATFPVGHAAGAAARSAHPARSARPPRADRGRFLRSGDLRLHRSAGRRRLRERRAASTQKPEVSGLRLRVPIVSIANPLSAKFDTLRPSLLPGLVDAVAHNRRHGRRDVQLFEIGTRFTTAGETRGVAMAWTGAAGGDHWSGGAREVDFFDVKGVAEHLARALGVAVRVEPVREPFLVAGQTASILVADGPCRGARVGVAGQLTPALADSRGLPRQDRVLVAELDLDLLQRARVAASDAARPLPRHPFVVRDLSIVVADSLPAEIIRDTILAAGRDLPAPLSALSVFDRYQGKGVPAGAVSLSLRLTFQASDRTLTDAEVQRSVDTILAALVREHAAVQR